MIAVRLDGRLGNQLFQYTFAFSLAKKYKTFYIIDNDNSVDYVKKYFKTNTLLNNRISMKIFKKLIAGKLNFVHQKGYEATDVVLPLIQNNTYYKGYFQSEQYFHDIKDAIKCHLRIKTKYLKKFNSKYGHLLHKKVLVIHYRLGDYLTWGAPDLGGPGLTLPETYYEKALKRIKCLNDYTILVVTDDKTNILTKLPSLPNKVIVSDDEILDFQVMMNAEIIIASNSTFCWWAAYLSEKNATVFVPENWLGFKVGKEYPRNIIPSKFIKIQCT